MASKLIILRHAERESIPDGEIGHEVSITKAGVDSTKLFSAGLKEPVISIESSPIHRCIQTARLIADMHGIESFEITTSTLLGDPGFFISDADLAWKSWQKLGSETVNRHLLIGTEQWPGFRPFEEAMAIMTDRIYSTLLDDRHGIAVWVTHDTILAAFASRVLDAPLTLDMWPDFLGSLTVTTGKIDKLNCYYSQRYGESHLS